MIKMLLSYKKEKGELFGNNYLLTDIFFHVLIYPHLRITLVYQRIASFPMGK